MRSDKIGIIGGSGAIASSFLLKRINELSVTFRNAKNDNDFFDIVLIQTSENGLDEQGNLTEKTRDNLLKNIHHLEMMDCDVIAIACNTVHYHYDYLNSLKKNEKTEIINLPELVYSFVPDKKTVGILCSSQSRKSKLGVYSEGIFLNDHEQEFLDSCISAVIENKISEKNISDFEKCLGFLKDKGAKSVILGCTELTFYRNKIDDIDIYDSVELLSFYLNVRGK